MASLPRFAIGSLQAQADLRPISWGLLTLLREAGLQVQHYFSRACFCPYGGAQAATGIASRHLDSWLMNQQTCREVFLHTPAKCDLRVVEGSLADDSAAGGGRLDVLCDWLELPRLGVVTISGCRGCQMPPRPAQADALLLDGVRDRADFCYWQTLLEPLWGKPLLGALPAVPSLKAEVAALRPGTSPPPELCHALARELGTMFCTQRLLQFANREGFDPPEQQLYRPLPGRDRVRLAVAYDEAFNCYFAETLDLLELRGAEVLEFSPLADESLPVGTDIVYLGCGRAGIYARELAANHCMLSALRNHVCRGRRIYAEGGGLAYLCQRLETPEGRLQTMVGVFPATARLASPLVPVEPIEVQLGRHTWLAEAGESLRGYLNHNWQVDASANLCSCSAREYGPTDTLLAAPINGQPQHEPLASQGCAVFNRRRAVGSRVHFNFALLPGVLPHFLQADSSPIGA